MKSELATVYRLSATLEAFIHPNGRITLQRNDRPPLRLSTTETRNLRASLAEQEG